MHFDSSNFRPAEFSCNKKNEVSIDFVSTTPIKDDIPSEIDNIEQDNTVESTSENANIQVCSPIHFRN